MSEDGYAASRICRWHATVRDTPERCVMGQGSGRLARSLRVQLTPVPQADSKQFAAAEQERNGGTPRGMAHYPGWDVFYLSGSLIVISHLLGRSINH